MEKLRQMDCDEQDNVTLWLQGKLENVNCDAALCA